MKEFNKHNEHGNILMKLRFAVSSKQTGTLSKGFLRMKPYSDSCKRSGITLTILLLFTFSLLLVSILGCSKEKPPTEILGTTVFFPGGCYYGVV